MKDFKVAGFPLPLYVLILALTAACMFTGLCPEESGSGVFGVDGIR